MQVTIQKWAKHNRKDVRKPTWFACSNMITEDDDLYSLSGDEFKVWIHLLCLASRNQSPTININFDSAHRKANLKKSVIENAVYKLAELQMLIVDVTDTLRTRYDDVTPHNITLHNITKHNICDLPEAKSLDEGDVNLKSQESFSAQDLLQLWNTTAHPLLPRVIKLTTKRRQQINSRLKEYPEAEFWQDAMTQLNSSKFCLGQVNVSGNRSKPWIADFDWFIKPDTAIKLLEGKYNQA